MIVERRFFFVFEKFSWKNPSTNRFNSETRCETKNQNQTEWNRTNSSEENENEMREKFLETHRDNCALDRKIFCFLFEFFKYRNDAWRVRSRDIRRHFLLSIKINLLWNLFFSRLMNVSKNTPTDFLFDYLRIEKGNFQIRKQNKKRKSFINIKALTCSKKFLLISRHRLEPRMVDNENESLSIFQYLIFQASVGLINSADFKEIIFEMFRAKINESWHIFIVVDYSVSLISKGNFVTSLIRFCRFLLLNIKTRRNKRRIYWDKRRHWETVTSYNMVFLCV